jgi:glycosyltransferase involved in cell wall biosynthesis
MDPAADRGRARFAGVTHVYTGNMYGGVESLLVTMARNPIFSGQSYALMFRGRLHEELVAAGADVFEIGSFRARYPWKLPGIRRRLRDGLRERGARAIVAHLAIPYAVAAPVADGRALLYFAHEFHLARHWSEHWARFSRPPDVVLANSAHVAPSVGSLFPNVETHVVRCPVELPSAAPVDRAQVRAELSTPESDAVILDSARLTPYKGHRVLIDALARLRTRPGWTAWICGGPQAPGEAEFLAELRTRAEKAGIAERVRFLGERRDVLRLLAAADMHCQPNVEPEHFGISFVEALACGVPVVTSAIGGALEIVTRETGELVPPRDPEALAAALVRCLEDPEKARSARLEGPKRARALCAPEGFADRLERALAAAHGTARPG